MTTLVKRNNGALFPELPSLFSDPFIKSWFNWPGSSDTVQELITVPSVNICETNDNYEITVAAPGMNKNDFKVELENNRLVISAETKHDNEHKSDNYLRREYSYQSFVRSFTLAEKQVSGEKITAKYADGILFITLPKAPEAKAKPARVIPIS